MLTTETMEQAERQGYIIKRSGPSDLETRFFLNRCRLAEPFVVEEILLGRVAFKVDYPACARLVPLVSTEERQALNDLLRALGCGSSSCNPFDIPCIECPPENAEAVAAVLVAAAKRAARARGICVGAVRN